MKKTVGRKSHDRLKLNKETNCYSQKIAFFFIQSCSQFNTWPNYTSYTVEDAPVSIWNQEGGKFSLRLRRRIVWLELRLSEKDPRVYKFSKRIIAPDKIWWERSGKIKNSKDNAQCTCVMYNTLLYITALTIKDALLTPVAFISLSIGREMIGKCCFTIL